MQIGRKLKHLNNLFSFPKTWVSPYINRFLQPDTLIPGVDSPQSWNRFSYVNNRPVNYNDPSGHCSVPVGQTFISGSGWVTALLSIICPNQSLTTPGADIVYNGDKELVPAHDLVGFGANIPEWGHDVIRFGNNDTHDSYGHDVFQIDRPTPLMSTKIRQPKIIKPGSTEGLIGGDFPDSVRERALQEDPTQTCVYCGRPGTGTDLDHIIPKNRGGGNTLENAQWTCPHCNRSKQDGRFPKTPPADYEGPWPPKWWKYLGGPPAV